MWTFGNAAFKASDIPFKLSQQVSKTSFTPLVLSSSKIINHCLEDSDSAIQKPKISFFHQY